MSNKSEGPQCLFNGVRATCSRAWRGGGTALKIQKLKKLHRYKNGKKKKLHFWPPFISEPLLDLWFCICIKHLLRYSWPEIKVGFLSIDRQKHRNWIWIPHLNVNPKGLMFSRQVHTEKAVFASTPGGDLWKHWLIKKKAQQNLQILFRWRVQIGSSEKKKTLKEQEQSRNNKEELEVFNHLHRSLTDFG